MTKHNATTTLMSRRVVTNYSYFKNKYQFLLMLGGVLGNSRLVRAAFQGSERCCLVKISHLIITRIPGVSEVT
jgi:hypothetical protein